MNADRELHLVYFYVSREMAKIIFAIQNYRLSPESNEYQSQIRLLEATKGYLDATEQEMARRLGDVSDLARSMRIQLDLNMEFVLANRDIDPDILKQSLDDSNADFTKAYEQFTGQAFSEEQAVPYVATLMKKHGILV